MPFKNPRDRKNYQRQYDANRRHTHKHIKVTLTFEKHRRFERFAITEEQSIPKTLCSLAEAKLDEVLYVTRDKREQLNEIVRLLRSCGNNINQIAHACNIQAGFIGNGTTPQQGMDLLHDIQEGLERMEVMVENKLKGV